MPYVMRACAGLSGRQRKPRVTLMNDAILHGRFMACLDVRTLALSSTGIGWQVMMRTKVATSILCCPLLGMTLSESEAAFKFYLSRCRITIERAFGIGKQRSLGTVPLPFRHGFLSLFTNEHGAGYHGLAKYDH